MIAPGVPMDAAWFAQAEHVAEIETLMSDPVDA